MARMQDADVARLTAQVLWLAFGLGVVFGAIAQRTHFCTMGAVADVMNLGDWTRARQWALAGGVAVLGFNGMAALGWLDAADTLYGGPRLPWLSALVGGLMFGFGMVLASGCGSRTLVRIGGGNLKSLVVFVVMAFAALATLRGLTAVWRVASVDQAWLQLPASQNLPHLAAAATGASREATALVVGGLVGLALVAWALAAPAGRSSESLLAGLGLGAVVAALWWTSGRFGFIAEHPHTLEPTFVATASRRMEALSFVAPLAHSIEWLAYFSDTSRHLTLGVASVAGVVAGSALQAVAGGSFHWEGFRGVEDTANHLVGAVLMGVGGVTALGCTVGQGLSGVATLSLGSFLTVAAIIVGAVLAVRYQAWRVERSA
jgi:uncharacterized membrane protein YedE/YeeE